MNTFIIRKCCMRTVSLTHQWCSISYRLYAFDIFFMNRALFVHNLLPQELNYFNEFKNKRETKREPFYPGYIEWTSGPVGGKAPTHWKLDFILWIDKSSILTKHLSEGSSETLEVPWYELGPCRTWTVSRRVSRSGSFYLINKVYN